MRLPPRSFCAHAHKNAGDGDARDGEKVRKTGQKKDKKTKSVVNTGVEPVALAYRLLALYKGQKNKCNRTPLITYPRSNQLRVLANQI